MTKNRAEKVLIKDNNENDYLKKRSLKLKILIGLKYSSIVAATLILTAVITYYATKLQFKIKTVPPQPILKYGLPSNSSYLDSVSYLVSYNNRLKIPNWGFEMLNKNMLEINNSSRDECRFRVDPRIAVVFQSNDRDYRNSGFDRGHIVPSANHRKSLVDNCATFLFTNVCPQFSRFNSGVWNRLERFVRNLVTDNDVVAYVATGPILANFPDLSDFVNYRIIGVSRVAVPSHMYKVILVECPNNRLVSYSFIIENMDQSQSSDMNLYITRISQVEALSGNQFFKMTNLEIEEKLTVDGSPCE